MSKQITEQLIEPFFLKKENDESEKQQKCKHEHIKFEHPGQGKYDIYSCLDCRLSITKRWEHHY